MALWIAEAGLSAARYTFMFYLMYQLSDPTYRTHYDYVYSKDFMFNSGVKYVNGVEKSIPSACEAGPSGNLPEFDFIVVGSGPGGSVVANRLALAFPQRTVVLVEAGPEASVNVVAPGMFPFGMKIEGTAAYHANPSPNYGNAFLNGIKMDVGRALGGTTNVNAFVYVCGTDEDWNYMANTTDDSSWNYQNMLPHIKSVMNHQDTSVTQDPECGGRLGTEGELKIGKYFSDEVPTIGLLQYAAHLAGYRNVEDFNCGKWTGFIRLRGTINDGERQSAAKAFLAPLRNQKNLMILQNAVVDKVIVSESNGSDKIKIKGVRVVTNNDECSSFNIIAKREVVLSAGGFNTPLILQRSGIGRAADLKPFGIQQKLDLNVGRNFHDHVMSVHVLTVPGEELSEEFMNNQVSRYFGERKGQFSYASSADIDGFINVYDRDSNHPNIQWAFFTFARNQSEFKHILEYTLEIKPEYVDQLEALNRDSALILTLNVLLKPKSSGSVKIRSTNPFDEPSIDANFLSIEEDVEIMIKGLRQLKDFCESDFMAYVGAKFEKIAVNECDALTYDSDDYWKCYFRYFTMTLWHPTGTARMGQKKNKDAVVDKRLKVFGVQGRPFLRVSDASPIPDEMSGNTQCGVYSLAAKAASMIIADNQ